MDTAVVLFTRDLRTVAQPALATACDRARRVVPVFVLDDAILGADFAAPNRLAFLLDSLAELRRALREAGGELFVRRGDPVRVVTALAHRTDAAVVLTSSDASGYAQRRQARLTAACEQHRLGLRSWPATTVLEPGAVTPSGGGDHYKVFTPYWRAWREHRPGAVAAAPEQVRVPDELDPGRLPELDELTDGRPADGLPPGGESAGRKRMRVWFDSCVADYPERRDDLEDEATSRLSAYLHLGCLSPAELVARADLRRSGHEAFVRQLCWRDFHHQVLAARPAAAHRDYRDRGDAWTGGEARLAAWREGRTGYPVVDAAMRQLAATGWMHNRARMLAASLLTKHLRVDWRRGAAHFLHHLVDGDLANNQLNWQWVAGTGLDTRPNRMFNPVRQGHRFDPSGAFVRRWVPELGGVQDGAVHEPWRLGGDRPGDYPDPIVDHETARRRLLADRGVDPPGG